MIEKDSEWILPENLRKQEERERKEIWTSTNKKVIEMCANYPIYIEAY